jgi:hypothetical protein
MPVPDFSSGEVLTAAAMDSIGLWKVASGTLSTATTNFVGCFTDSYKNYVITLDQIAVSGAADVYFRFLENTTAFTGSYPWAMRGLTVAGAGSDSNNGGAADAGYTGITVTSPSGPIASAYLQVFGTRQNNARSHVLLSCASFQSAWYSRSGMSFADDNRLFNGIQFLSKSTPTFTGNVTIYGCRT